MGKHRHTTLSLSSAEQARLELIARDLGYCQTRGVGAQKRIGNISALMQAIARGELGVVPSNKNTASYPPTLMKSAGESQSIGDNERLNTAQAAARLRLSIRTVQKQIQKGALKARRFGRAWSITPQDLAAFDKRFRARGRKRGRGRSVR